jgi:hypothetical protein
VRTFGWYVRKMIADVKVQGAAPILLSLTIRDRWSDGKIERDSGRYRSWIRELAAGAGVPVALPPPGEGEGEGEAEAPPPEAVGGAGEALPLPLRVAAAGEREAVGE